MLVCMYKMYKADVCFAAVSVVGISQAWEEWYHKTIKVKTTREERLHVVGRFSDPPPRSLSRCQNETRNPKKTYNAGSLMQFIPSQPVSFPKSSPDR